VYTNNKLTILSSTLQNNVPTLRAHNIFKNCPENIAKAIINYYTNLQDNNISLAEIDTYVKGTYSGTQYKIKPPDELFEKSLTKTIDQYPNDISDKPSLVEFNIISITQKDFFGTISDINPNETIKPSSENVLELNIVISSKK